jgi:hypothetical protein
LLEAVAVAVVTPHWVLAVVVLVVIAVELKQRWGLELTP